MKTIKITLLLIFINIAAIAQNTVHNETEYTKKVKQFYQLLDKDFVSTQECIDLFGKEVLEAEISLFFEECSKSNSEEICTKKYDKYYADYKKSNSLFFKKIKKIKNLFVLGYGDSIDILINKSTIYDEYNPGNISLDLKFPNGKIIYFYLNKYTDEPLTIINIYFSNGEEFYNYLGNSKKNYLKRIGIINNSENSINIREKPTKDSKILWKLEKDELFYFTPSSESSWWYITNINKTLSGYIESYKVNQFGYLSNDRKKTLIQLNKNYPFIKTF